jgi:hypothetical protein
VVPNYDIKPMKSKESAARSYKSKAAENNPCGF